MIGEQIKKRRIELGLTQKELAEKLGYKSNTTINKIELGINDISQSKVIEFAKALNTTPAYIMGWTVRDEDAVNRTLGEIIKAYRTEQGMSMDDFSKVSGISKAFISVLEMYKRPGSCKPVEPSVKCVKQAAKAMGVDFIELILAISEE